MIGLSDYGELLVLDILFGGRQSAPATYYFALLTAEPDDDDDGSTISEVSGGSYTRVSVTNNTTNFAAASASTDSLTTLTDITFPTATADWGTVKYIAILDSATLGAGNVIAVGKLTVNRRIASGTVSPTIPAGSIVFKIKTEIATS